MTQAEFDALSESQQYHAILTALTTSPEPQRKFESLSRSKQLYYLFAGITELAAGGSITIGGADGDLLFNNAGAIDGVPGASYYIDPDLGGMVILPQTVTNSHLQVNGRIYIGGRAAGNTMLKGNTTELQVRLGNDTDFAGFRSQYFQSNTYIIVDPNYGVFWNGGTRMLQSGDGGLKISNSAGTIGFNLVGETDGTVSLYNIGKTQYGFFRFLTPGRESTATTDTVTAADAASVVRLNNAGAITLNIPGNLPAGMGFGLLQKGLGQVTVTATSGATIINRQSQFKSAGQGAMLDVWVDSNTTGTNAIVYIGGDTAA